jgi:Bacterial Ig domain
MNTRGIAGVLAVVLAAGALLVAGQVLFPSAPDLLPIPGPSERSADVVVVPAPPPEGQKEEPEPPAPPVEPLTPADSGAVPIALPDDAEQEELPQILVGENGYVRNGRVRISLGSSALQGQEITLERRLAPLLSGECGDFGPWGITADNASLPPASCALYRILVDGTVVFTLPEVARYDGSRPELPAVDVLEDGAREFVDGSQLYVAAEAATLAPVTILANPADPESGVASVTYRGAGADAELSASPWSAEVTPSVGTIEVTAANNAGDTTTATVEVVADGEAPFGGSISYPAFAKAGESVSVTADPGFDSGSGVDASSVVVERRLAVRSEEGCEPFGDWKPTGSEDTALEGTCAQYRLRVQDNVANEAVFRSDAVLEVPDETPPETAIAAPAPTAELTGRVDVIATAEDSGAGVRSVTIQVARASSVSWAVLGTATAAPYSVEWDTALFKPGRYSLRSVAVDRAGHVATSEVVSVVVADDKRAPATWIVEPAVGATVSGVVTVSAQAEDHESGVESVTLEVRSRSGCWVELGTFDGSSGSVAWDTTALDPGRYQLRSVATDRRGNDGRSSPIAVIVEAEASEPPAEEESEPGPKSDDYADDNEPPDEEAAEEQTVEEPAGEESAAEDEAAPEPSDEEPAVEEPQEEQPEGATEVEPSADKDSHAHAGDETSPGADEREATAGKEADTGA